MPDLSRHPCFNVKAKGNYGRIHLPVAPKCNILCNFCNRKFDCVNESRPGVTSAVLAPGQAARYLDAVLEREPRISVVGIAGPGDPFANAAETLETIRLIRRNHPELIFCLSSNGLGLPPHLDELKELGVTHVTVTVNAVDPEIGKNVYAWAREGKVVYRGIEAARLLLARQLESIEGLKSRGIVVKVNSIVIPGVNSGHIEDVARTMAGLGVDMLNAIPLHPNPDTKFADVPEPTKEMMHSLRDACEQHLPQMRHCRRCRADAVGLLDSDRSSEFHGCLSAHAKMALPADEARPYTAVATAEGVLVNQHLGEASRFQIWRQEGGSFHLVEERTAPKPGNGPKRWYGVAELLKDCRAVLVSGVGDTPRAILEEEGIQPVEASGFISDALAAVYGAADLSALKGRRKGLGGCACKGAAGGGEGC